MNCGLCRYSHPVAGLTNKTLYAGDDAYLCRRHAPRTAVDIDVAHATGQEVTGIGFAVWPTVIRSDWCGEYAAENPS